MMAIDSDTLTPLLPDLGDPADMLSSSRSAARAPIRSNAHIHLPPNFSAFDTVAQAVGLAEEQGIEVHGVSNYYDYQLYREFEDEAKRYGIFPLYGLEIITLIEDLRDQGVKINDPGNPGKFYLCGKGITQFSPMNDEACDRLAVIRQNDSARMAQMAEKMAGVFAAQGIDTGLNASAIKARVARRHDCPTDTVYLQERHLAQAFQEVMFERTDTSERPAILEKLFGTASKADPDDAVALQGEIRSYLMKTGKSAFVPETFVGFDHAYRLILALGGIPSYPTLADGNTPICAFETPVEHLIDEIKGRGITAAEFIPIRNTPEVLGDYVRAMRASGLVVTAGTEHNTLDLVPLEPTCLNGAPIPEDIRAIFEEGTCVIAAHQYLTLSGKPGFVDASGKPNSDYETAEERIAAFAKLGAEVIHRYREAHAPAAGAS
jgi:hypothetical protein